MVRHRQPSRLHEVDSDQRGDVGDREPVASDELAFSELFVEQFENQNTRGRIASA
jgi:hypothetical protein